MIVAVDADSPDTAAAEHLLHEVLAALPGPVVACTHRVSPGDHPHFAVSIARPAAPAGPVDAASTGEWEWFEEQVRSWAAEHGAGLAISRPGASAPELAGPSTLVRGAYVAAVEAALGTGGRVVRWPGDEYAHGVRSVADLRNDCHLDAIEALGNLPVADEAPVDTRDWLRPLRRDGRFVLQVQPAAGGLLIPFELEHQHRCCADH